MINIFPIYPDEIAYSIFARFNSLSGNLCCSQTSSELFDNESISYSVYYPTYLENFIKKIPSEVGITSESFINNQSLLPLFKPFMTDTRAKLVIDNILKGAEKSLKDRMGITSGNIYKSYSDVIKICPYCYKEELDEHKEAFLHRLHQVPGNFICDKHEVYLYEYLLPSRRILFDLNDIDINLLNTDEIDTNLKEFYLNLSDDIKYVLNGGFEQFDKNKIQIIYRNKLIEKGYMSNTIIKRSMLVRDFLDFYPKEFLMKLESYIDKDFEKNWIADLTTYTVDYVHPIRHLLFIRFLFGSACSIVNEEFEYKHFGDGPWPCLNPAADHYKELVINNCKAASMGKVKGVIGYFKCSCGFEYTRKGPDKSENDKYRYTKVTKVGEVWENKLRDLILNTDLNVKELAKEMGCCGSTILKYAIKNGIYDKLNTVLKYKSRPTKKIDMDLYKKEVTEFINNNPEAYRSEIESKLKKQYVYLYKHDKDWLESVLPEPYKNGKAFNRGYCNEDWVKLDTRLADLINESITDILNDEKVQRITITKISKKISYHGILNKKILNKLPNTKELLDLKCESTEQYHNRINKSNKIE